MNSTYINNHTLEALLTGLNDSCPDPKVPVNHQIELGRDSWFQPILDAELSNQLQVVTKDRISTVDWAKHLYMTYNPCSRYW